MTDGGHNTSGTEQPEYQYICPVCNADSGDITFDNPQKAREFAPNPVGCASCGNEVTPAIVDRSVRTDTDDDLRTDGGRSTDGTERSEGLAYGGVCPVCGDEFTDGFHRLQDRKGESIEGVRICLIDPPEECLFHLPTDQNDRSIDADSERGNEYDG
jgi:hypothetical protein